jgi:hypothetical protein
MAGKALVSGGRVAPPRAISRIAAVAALIVAALLIGGARAPSASPALEAPPAAEDSLSFEAPGSTDSPPGSSVPPGTVSRDSTVAHSGRCSARIQRDSTSLGEFSSLNRLLPLTCAGDTLELRGWLKLDGVRGHAGLWLREDGRTGFVQFDNMENRGLSGTIPWAEYRIALPLDPRARRIAFGALLVGDGLVHADDLRLLVDGKPLSEAPPAVREPTAVDTDHEFDAGSGIATTTVSPVQVENLALLARVWGFVKYHHLRVTSAQLHWDYELFRVVPSVLAAKSRAAAIEAIDAWLSRVGEPAPCAPCAPPPAGAYLPSPIGWIHDRARLGPELSGRLERIYENRAAGGDDYYVAFQMALNPDFSTEELYPQPEYPDAGYRLLALFRFWNIMEYWFPYRNLIPGRWEDVLTSFIPRLLGARDREEYRLAMLALAARVHDGHANVWNVVASRPPRGGCRLPVALRFVEGRYVVAAYVDSALGPAGGLEVGDLILALDGAPVDSLAAGWSEYYGTSNASALRWQMAQALAHGPCGPCRVALERAGKRLERTAVRDSAARFASRAGLTHDLPGEPFRLLSKDVAYLKLSSVRQRDAASYIGRAAGTRCFVIDIRNYPSEFVPWVLGQHLVDRPTPFVRFTHGDPVNPGAFLWTDSLVLRPEPPHYDGTVVVLVDETSMSQSEYTAMAFRAAPRAIVVGSTTAGADGNLSRIPLPGGLMAAMSGIGVFYPDGRPTQQVGIVPDLVVRPTIRGIREGRDEVLEAGVTKALGREFRLPATAERSGK